MTEQSTFLRLLNSLVIPRADGGGLAKFGDVAAPHQVALLEAAEPALLGRPDAPHQWFVQICHRAAAKSTTAMILALGKLLSTPLPIRVVIVSTDKDAGKVLIQIARMIVSLNKTLGDRLDVGQWKVVRPETGGEIEIMSSDAASFYGQLPALLIVDEFGHWGPAAETLWTAIASTLPKDRNLALIVLSNAGWIDSWQHRVFEQLRATPHCWYQHLHVLSPWITEAQIEAQRRLLPDSDFRRLWVPCEFVPGVAGGLHSEVIEDAITLPGPMQDCPEGITMVGGLDLGLRRDHSSFAVLACDFEQGRVRLAEIRNWRPPSGGMIDFDAIRSVIVETCRRLRVKRIYYDPWSCEQLAQQLRKANVVAMHPSHSHGESMTQRAVSLMEGMNDRRVDLYDTTEAARLLIHDLRRCSILDRPTGKKVESPRDEHGHGDRLSAFLLPLPVALRAVSRPRRTGPVGRLAISGVGQVLNSSGQFQSVDHAERVVLQRARQLRGPSVF